jgi:hypothetical protein
MRPAQGKREAALAAAQSVQGASWQRAVERVEQIVCEHMQQVGAQRQIRTLSGAFGL